MKQPKILLLQIREDARTAQEEFLEFVEYSGLQEKNFFAINAFEQSDFSPSMLQEYDALFVGGSSDASVLKPEKYPFVNPCLQLIRWAHDINLPIFASCFGFQLAVVEFGGRIILDKSNMEMGCAQIQLTPTAKSDPLLSDTPETFWCVSGHQERADKAPDEFILLGKSEHCPIHILRYPDRPFYAFQFHPEVDCKDLIIRITRYQERYLNSTDDLQKIKDNAIYDTQYANRLVEKFVQLYL